MKRTGSEVVKKVRLATIQRVEENLKILAGPNREKPRNVHATRVATKQLRATWQLLRPIVGTQIQRQANERLKITAKQLARRRQTHVLSKTILRLEKRTKSRHEKKALRNFQRALMQRMATEQYRDTGSTDWDVVLKGLRGEKRQWQRVSVDGIAKLGANQGLRRTYQKCRTTGQQAFATGDSRCFHDWRKWTKYLYYQIRSLADLGAARETGLVDNLEKLGNKLGIHNDMFDLQQALGQLPESAISQDCRSTVAAMIDRFDGQSIQRLRKIYRRTFTMKPNRFLESTLRKKAAPPRNT